MKCELRLRALTDELVADLAERGVAEADTRAWLEAVSGQSLAQMSLLWVLRDPRVTSALIGARTVEQLDDSLDALNGSPLTPEELAEIDRYATDGGIDLWRASSSR